MYIIPQSLQAITCANSVSAAVDNPTPTEIPTMFTNYIEGENYDDFPTTVAINLQRIPVLEIRADIYEEKCNKV